MGEFDIGVKMESRRGAATTTTPLKLFPTREEIAKYGPQTTKKPLIKERYEEIVFHECDAAFARRMKAQGETGAEERTRRRVVDVYGSTRVGVHLRRERGHGGEDQGFGTTVGGIGVDRRQRVRIHEMIRFSSIPFRFVSFRFENEPTNASRRATSGPIRFDSIRFHPTRGSALDRSTANRACAPYP